MKDNYKKAYKEIVEILRYVPKESVNKIPKNMIEVFTTNMDNEYEFHIDINKNFEEQKILEETKAILANIFRDYWATPYQKERIIAHENYDRQKIEKQKNDKYNPNDIFKIKNKNQEEKANNLPVEHKEKFYKKILGFLKKIFNK